ncbi:hypothetical protein JCM8202_004641 [Rhodotorula sphaerocarpa]
MDLLTQPVAYHSQQAQPQAEQQQPAKQQSGDDGASVQTTSTSDAAQQTAANFGHLRTAAPAAADGLAQEPRIEPPSVVKGDWRVFGRVKAQCVFWHEGTLPEKGLGANWRRSRDKLADVHEWLADGTLWITKTGEIVFVLDNHSSPTLVDRSNRIKSPSGSGTEDDGARPRRLSLSGLRRSTSRDSSRAITPTGTGPTTGAAAEAHTPTNENPGGMRGFVKKLVSAISPSSSKKELPAEETETPAPAPSTEPVAPNTQPAQARTEDRPEEAASSEPTGVGIGLQFDEPQTIRDASDPLPAYKGHPITALVIGSAAHIRSMRFFPHRPSESVSPGNLALSSTDLHDLVDIGGKMEYPSVVELDVSAWVDPTEPRDGFDEENSLIRKREVTIGFAFRDVLLLHEAEEFRTRVESFVAAATPAERVSSPTFGSALMRTISGRSLGGRTEEAEASGPATAAADQQQTHKMSFFDKAKRSGSGSNSGSWMKPMPQGDVRT